jgi:hypothetical protein
MLKLHFFSFLKSKQHKQHSTTKCAAMNQKIKINQKELKKTKKKVLRNRKQRASEVRLFVKAESPSIWQEKDFGIGIAILAVHSGRQIGSRQNGDNQI